MVFRLSSALVSATTILSALSCVHAIHFPISKQVKRDSTGNFGNSTVAVSNFGNIQYSANVTIGGKTTEVQIDTGSPDLLIIGNVPGANTTDANATLAFGVGTVQGNVSIADLDFAGFHVPNQAFILGTNVSSDFDEQNGIIGLGPSTISNTRQAFGSSAGDPPLDRIFRQNTSTPNILTVLLSRADDLMDFNTTDRAPQTGLLSIGEVVEGYDAISYSPKLYAAVDSLGQKHWQTNLDSNGIIGPDGQRIETPTSVGNITAGAKDQFRVVFDTGFSIPQFPPNVIDSIYGRIPGVSNFTTGGQFFYNFSCEYELNVIFLFGGVEFPIHPLDLSLVGDTDDEGNRLWCISGFGPTLGNVAGNSAFGAFDVILGDNFLRNAYILINFGDFVDGSSSSVKDPFIQLLPTTDRVTAHRDFVNARLSGVDTTSSQPALLPVSQESHAADPDTNGTNQKDSDLEAISGNGDDDSKHFYQETWFIVMVSVVGGVLLISLGLLLLSCCRRRRSNVRSETAFVPPMVGGGSYKPLMAERRSAGPHDDEIFNVKYEEPSFEHGRYSHA